MVEQVSSHLHVFYIMLSTTKQIMAVLITGSVEEAAFITVQFEGLFSIHCASKQSCV